MAWFDSGVKVKSKSQLKNNLMIACSSVALVLTFGQPLYGPRPLASAH